MRKWVAGLLLSISVILLTISLYFLMGFFVQERQDNQLQQELQELMQEKSLYQTGTTAKYRDKLLTLSTCEYSQKNGRMVLVAKKNNGKLP